MCFEEECYHKEIRKSGQEMYTWSCTNEQCYKIHVLDLSFEMFDCTAFYIVHLVHVIKLMHILD